MKKYRIKLFLFKILKSLVLILNLSVKVINSLKYYFKNSFFLTSISFRFVSLIKKMIKIILVFKSRFSFVFINLKKAFFIIKLIIKRVSFLTYRYVIRDRISPNLRVFFLRFYKKKNLESQPVFILKIFYYFKIFLIWISLLIIGLLPFNTLKRFFKICINLANKILKIDFLRFIRVNILIKIVFLTSFFKKCKSFFLYLIDLFFSFLMYSKNLFYRFFSILKLKFKFLYNILLFSLYVLKKRIKIGNYLIKIFNIVRLFFSVKILFLKFYRFLITRKKNRIIKLLLILNKYRYLRIPLSFFYKFLFFFVILIKKSLVVIKARILSFSYCLKNLSFFLSFFKKISLFSSLFLFYVNRLVFNLQKSLSKLRLYNLLNKPILILKNRVSNYYIYLGIFFLLLKNSINSYFRKIFFIARNLKNFKKIFIFTNILWLLKPFLKLEGKIVYFLVRFINKTKNSLIKFLGLVINLITLTSFRYLIEYFFKKRFSINVKSYKLRAYFFDYFRKKSTSSLIFIKKNILFVRKIALANWVKNGYFISVFLIVSLLGFSFNALTYYNSRSFNIKDITVCYEKPVFKTFFSKDFKEFKEVSNCKESSIVISDKFTEKSIILEIDAPIIVGPKDFHNISYKDLILSLKKGYVNDYTIFITKKAKESFFKEYNIPLSDSIDWKKNLFIISFEELEPDMNVIMVDGYYPSKSMIVNNFYPLSKIIVANVKSEYYEEIKTLIKPQPKITSFIAGGDIMLDRGVKSKIESNGDEYIIEDLKKLFLSADISFANLECPISNRGSMFNLEKGIFFRCKPEYIKILKKLGIDILSLANNHILDYGLTAAIDTMNYLNREKILYTGMGLDRDESLLSPILRIGDKRIRILAYNDIYPYSYNAEENVPGLLILNKSNIASDIKRAKEGVDYIFVSIHTGEEFILYPEENKIRLFRSIIDMGADGILGGHTHTFQPIEIYKGKFIVYSLGNLIFDQYRLGKNLQEQMVVEINFYNGSIKYIYTHFFKVDKDLKPYYVKGDSEDYIYLAERSRMDYSKQIAKKGE